MERNVKYWSRNMSRCGQSWFHALVIFFWCTKNDYFLTSLIYLLSVESEHYDIATKLAEKYLDFQALVQIADRTNDEERLAEYNEKFKEYVRICTERFPVALSTNPNLTFRILRSTLLIGTCVKINRPPFSNGSSMINQRWLNFWVIIRHWRGFST